MALLTAALAGCLADDQHDPRDSRDLCREGTPFIWLTTERITNLADGDAWLELMTVDRLGSLAFLNVRFVPTGTNGSGTVYFDGASFLGVTPPAAFDPLYVSTAYANHTDYDAVEAGLVNLTASESAHVCSLVEARLADEQDAGPTRLEEACSGFVAHDLRAEGRRSIGDPCDGGSTEFRGRLLDLLEGATERARLSDSSSGS